jgi:hypothetical protein
VSTAAQRLADLFDTVERNSWRWECQGDYQVDEAKLQRWRAGLPFEETRASLKWHAYVRDLRQRGIPFERVRMLTEPLTEYLRWMLGVTYRNINAGEDIRWITESRARALKMPDYDFYIIDDERVAIMRFDADKVLVDLEVVHDASTLATHQAYRDTVWPLAIRHNDYLAMRAERST